MATALTTPKKKPGRPAKQVFTDEEVSVLLELPLSLVRARCRLSFFPGAKLVDPKLKQWEIPESALKMALLTKVEPHWSASTWAPYVGITRDKLYRVTHAVTSLSDPLPPGKSVRALLLCFGDTKPVKRIPQSEILRFMGGEQP